MTLPSLLPAHLAEQDTDTTTHTLPNGVRVVAIALPHIQSASVSVFVRTGSRDESPALNGISHVAEHMAFKGTAGRDARQINLDAERLGAEVDAHTDKDHTAYHLRGLAEHVLPFIAMLGDIVLHSSFPEQELEQERQVILQELLEDEDDPMSTAFKLFDKACYGTQPLAQPVIGLRRNIERLTRADLAGYVQRQYTGSNVVVGVAGPIDVPAVVDAVAAAFGAMPAGRENRGEAPAYLGGTRALRMAGSNQSHWVLGFPVPAQGDDDPAAAQVAAALFGEGMSSPLMHEIRERRGLVYYAACSADMSDLSGQFVIEASTTAEHLDACFDQVTRLLREQARAIDAADLQRSRNQIAVRRLRSLERPYLRLEEAAQDLFMLGRVRSAAERRLQIDAVSAGRVQQVFERMLAERPAVALVGRLGKWSTPRLAARFGAVLG